MDVASPKSVRADPWWGCARAGFAKKAKNPKESAKAARSLSYSDMSHRTKDLLAILLHKSQEPWLEKCDISKAKTFEVDHLKYFSCNIFIVLERPLSKQLVWICKFANCCTGMFPLQQIDPPILIILIICKKVFIVLDHRHRKSLARRNEPGHLQIMGIPDPPVLEILEVPKAGGTEKLIAE